MQNTKLSFSRLGLPQKNRRIARSIKRTMLCGGVKSPKKWSSFLLQTKQSAFEHLKIWIHEIGS